jgi:predicted ATPase with chaperone activity
LRVARARQVERQGVLNSALLPGDLERYAAPDRETCDLLQFAAAKLNLSARAYGQILRVRARSPTWLPRASLPCTT